MYYILTSESDLFAFFEFVFLRKSQLYIGKNDSTQIVLVPMIN